MSLALKRKFPKIYFLFKKFEKYIPALTKLWDQKNYLVNLKVVSMMRYWRHYPRLKAEADIVFAHYNGGDFIDVGAFEGVYSFILAPKAKANDTFISCEPNPNEKQCLSENLNTLKRIFKNIKFIPDYNPVGDGKNVVRLPTVYGHPVFIKPSNGSLKTNDELFKIKSTSLDQLVEFYKIKPKFIKIDVEGAEYSVLQGMTNILQNYNPTIMIEKHPELIPKSLQISNIDNLLIDKGYKVQKKIFKDDIAITEIWEKK